MTQMIKVFLASPGDVSDERLIVRKVVEEENRNHFDYAGYHLEIVGWETHSSPGVGRPHAQGRINPLIDDCELFIGIFWTRFGSPTGEAESGTEEECERAFTLLAKPELPLCDIKLYFCDYPIRPSMIDLDQLEKVRQFQQKIEKSSEFQYWSIDNVNQFERDFRQHLNIWFRDYIERGGQKRLVVKTEKMPETVTSESVLSFRFQSVTKGFNNEF